MNEVLELLENLFDKYEIEQEYRNKVSNEIKEGFIESLNLIETYDFVAKTIMAYVSKEPSFSNIASEIQYKIYEEKIGRNYLNLIQKQYSLGLLSDCFYNFVLKNKSEIEQMIIWERDNLIDYFGLKTLERSYLLIDKENNHIERPQMVWMRTAIQIHGLKENLENNSIELIKETYDYMSQLYFTHATPTLFNSGGRYPQLSSCYLLQCPDDLSKIADTFGSIMLISKWAGGIGVNLSDIRSNGSIIKSNGGKTNGIIPLCKVLESLARYVNQAGKRQGGIATYLETWHGDIEDFIDLRKNTGDENLRARDLFLGLWVCDEFMKAVELDTDWYLMNPNECLGLTESWGDNFKKLYWDYVSQGKYVKKIKARELYNKITTSQFETGMPYIMFKDTINKRSNQQNLGTIKNSNLCSEIVEYSSPDEIAVCNLASISLPKFIDLETNKFNFNKLGEITEILVKNLNNIIDINFYPVIQTEKSNLLHRPIGIGVQGLADCYFKLGFGFDSDEAIKLNKQIFECIYFHALHKSMELAKINGPYSSFKNSPFSKGLLQFHLGDKNISDISDPELNLDWHSLINNIKKYGTRNSLLTTIMPTASTAQILTNNESIEPYASNMYVRKVLAGEYLVVNKHLVNDLKKYNLWNSNILAELQFDNGSVQKLDIPDFLKQKYKTAYELKQSVIVKQSIDRGLFIDQSQSMNLFFTSPDANKLASAHIFAWKNGLKTGSYYIRSQPITEAIKFSIDIDLINLIKLKRGNNEINSYIELNKKYKDNLINIEEQGCTTCSA